MIGKARCERLIQTPVPLSYATGPLKLLKDAFRQALIAAWQPRRHTARFVSIWTPLPQLVAFFGTNSFALQSQVDVAFRIGGGLRMADRSVCLVLGSFGFFLQVEVLIHELVSFTICLVLQVAFVTWALFGILEIGNIIEDSKGCCAWLVGTPTSF